MCQHIQTVKSQQQDKDTNQNNNNNSQHKEGSPKIASPPLEHPIAKSLDKDDQGMCLSMHQPWAALVVYGIKKLEGRSWYSDYRGRLWIASTVQQPDDVTIATVEMQYTGFTQKPFPPHYPTGVLLGCVDVIDMVSQEEHQRRQNLLPPEHRTSEEENGSNFMFVCVNPRRLIMPFPVKGDHKIWKLPRKTVELAQKGLKDS